MANNTVLMFREYLRDFSHSLVGKINSFISLNVYDKPLELLKLYYLKGGLVNTYVKLSRVNITINAATVNNAIRLAKVLREFKGYYAFKNNNVCVNFDNDFCWNIRDILESESSYQFFKQFLYLKKANAILSKESYGFLVILDNIKWFIRDSVWQDIMAGPLLPIYHEPYEYNKWFHKIIRRVRVFIDVGAYVGGYAVRACKAGVNVYAVEPDTYNYSVLRQNLKLNGCNATLFKVAAGDFRGKAEMRLQHDYGPDSLTLTSYGDVKYVVDVMPLDDIISGVERPAMAKIDVEGFEEHVLRGMSNLLKSIDYILIETRERTHKSSIKFLSKHGFRLIDLRLHKGGDHLWFNSLLVKRQ